MVKSILVKDDLSIPYYIRKSSRAKRLSMNITQEKGLEIVIPEKYNQRKIEDFIGKNTDWIIKNYKKRERLSHGSKIEILGREKTVLALSKIEHQYKKTPLVYEGENEIYAYSANELKKYLFLKAKKIIPKRVEQIADKMGLKYNVVRVKEQKTRWGSCSVKKNLNFNWKLILADPLIMDSIIVHELAHLVHLNHGKQFYELVEKYSPNYKLHIKKLKKTVMPF